MLPVQILQSLHPSLGSIGSHACVKSTHGHWAIPFAPSTIFLVYLYFYCNPHMRPSTEFSICGVIPVLKSIWILDTWPRSDFRFLDDGCLICLHIENYKPRVNQCLTCEAYCLPLGKERIPSEHGTRAKGISYMILNFRLWQPTLSVFTIATCLINIST